MHRPSVLAAGLLLAVMFLGACSSSSHPSAAAQASNSSVPGGVTIETTSTVPRPTADDPTMAKYCEIWRAIANVGPLDNRGDPDVVAKRIRDHYSKVLPLTSQLEQVAPDAIRDAVHRAIEVIQLAVQQGTTEPFQDKANGANAERLLEFSQGHCAQ